MQKNKIGVAQLENEIELRSIKIILIEVIQYYLASSPAKLIATLSILLQEPEAHVEEKLAILATAASANNYEIPQNDTPKQKGILSRRAEELTHIVKQAMSQS